MDKKKILFISLIGLSLVISLISVINYFHFKSEASNIFEGTSVGFTSGNSTSTFDNDGITTKLVQSGILGEAGKFNITIDNTTNKNIKYLVVIEVDDFDTTQISHYSDVVCAAKDYKTSMSLDYDSILNGSYMPYIIKLGTCE